MNERFRELLDAHPGWPADVRANVAGLGEDHAHDEAPEVEFLPTAWSTVVEQGPAATVAKPDAGAQPAADTPKPATPAAEPWATKTEVAAALHVSTKTIGRWVRLGMPCGGPAGAVRFKLSECAAWRSGEEQPVRTAGPGIDCAGPLPFRRA
jgi:hypothetical protein